MTANTSIPKYLELETVTLLEKFGKGSHKPGSGSAAALSSILGCKLINTVTSLTISKKERYGEKIVQQLTLANNDIVADIEPRLLDLFQRDAEQFDLVIKARRKRNRYKKGTKEWRKYQRTNLKELQKATEIVIEIAELSLLIAKNGITIFDLGFQPARGDSSVAISTSLTGSLGSIGIAYLNLTSYRGSKWATKTRKKCDTIQTEARKIQIQFYERISRLQSEVLRKEGIKKAPINPSGLF